MSNTEIERKFLLRDQSWRQAVSRSQKLRQGYLSDDKARTVRVRVVNDVEGWLTIKGLSVNNSRPEYEYAIPAEEAAAMLDSLCKRPLLEKIRHIVVVDGMTWEIDEFLGDNAGLVVAEIELQAVEQEFTRPDWLGEEVSSDPRYFNSSLVQHPFSEWAEQGGK